MQVRCSLGELCATSHTGEQDLGAGSRDGFCFSSAFVQGVDDTPGGRPHGEGPYWRSGRGGGRLQVPHVEAGCEKEAAQLLLVPKVTRPAQSYLTGHLLPSEATRV